MQSSGFGVSKESALLQISRDFAVLLPLGLGMGLGSTGHLSSNTCFGQLEREHLKICSSLPVHKLIFRGHELWRPE